MISQKDMISMVLSGDGSPDAHYFDERHRFDARGLRAMNRQPNFSSGPTIDYGLRLVRQADGTLRWEDGPAGKLLTRRRPHKKTCVKR